MCEGPNTHTGTHTLQALLIFPKHVATVTRWEDVGHGDGGGGGGGGGGGVEKGPPPPPGVFLVVRKNARENKRRGA